MSNSNIHLKIKSGLPEEYGTYLFILKDGSIREGYYSSFSVPNHEEGTARFANREMSGFYYKKFVGWLQIPKKNYGFHFTEIIGDTVWFAIRYLPDEFDLIQQPHLEITCQSNNRIGDIIWKYAIRKKGSKYIINGAGSRSEHAKTTGIAIAKEIEVRYGIGIPY